MRPKFQVGQVVADTRYKAFYGRVVAKSLTPYGWQYDVTISEAHTAEERVRITTIPEFVLRAQTVKEFRGHLQGATERHPQ